MSDIYIVLLVLLGIILTIYFYYFILFRFLYPVCESDVCLNGKVALVTGGSSGLGYQISRRLAARGCKVIIADKLVDENIKETTIKETENPNIVLEYCDFASLRSIREFVKKLKESEDKLDILVNNVGVGKAPHALTEDGLNMSLQINYLGTFLLTHLLVDLLKKSGNGRVIFTTSVLAFLHILTARSFTSDFFTKYSKYFEFRNYLNSKFTTIVAADIFAEKLKKYNITCNIYHPGIASTTIFQSTRKYSNWWNITDLVPDVFMIFVAVSYGIHPKLACQPALILALYKEYKTVTGMFYGIFPKLRPRAAKNRKLCDMIWKASVDSVSLMPEERLD